MILLQLKKKCDSNIEFLNWNKMISILNSF
jgi:hypothetical protein